MGTVGQESFSHVPAVEVPPVVFSGGRSVGSVAPSAVPGPCLCLKPLTSSIWILLSAFLSGVGSVLDGCFGALILRSWMRP